MARAMTQTHGAKYSTGRLPEVLCKDSYFFESNKAFLQTPLVASRSIGRIRLA